MKLSFLLFLFASLEPTAANECAECMDFLSKYGDADDSKAAEKECKIISSDKDLQKACKKVVKDVLKKGKDGLDSCKDYGWCPISPPTKAPTTSSPTNAPTRKTAAEPTSNPTFNPTTSPTDRPTLAPTMKKPPTCAPTSHPTGTSTRKPTSIPTSNPTEQPTLVPTDPKPDEDECAECMGFLSRYADADDSKAAEKECKVISSDKDVQKACKKVVKDVLKKGLNALDSCKAYDWCPAPRVRARRTAECEEEPTRIPTNAPTRITSGRGPTSNPTTSPTDQPTLDGNPTTAPTRITASEPTSNPTSNPTKSPHCTCAPTSLPTESPTRSPTSNPTKSPTDHPTVAPTDPKPDEEECTQCMNFLLKYEDADDSKAAEKECKVISSDKVVQKACKKVVKDVLKKGKDGLDSCKAYGWCPAPRTRARRIAECVCEDEPTSSPTNEPTRIVAVAPTAEPTSNPTSNPTNGPTDRPTSIPTKNHSSTPTMRPTRIPTRNPTSNPTKEPTSMPSITPPDGLGNTLDDCIKVADQFRNTCTQFDIDSKHTVTNMTPEEVTCKNWPVDEEYGCIGDLQGDNSCVWERKLCVTCYTKNQGNTEITMIRVQTNNMPDHCPGNPLVQPQDFDYEVEFNRPPDITRVTFENQVVTKDILRPVQETRTYNNEASAEVCPLNHKYTGIQEMNDNSESKRVLAIAINGVAFQNANQKDDDPVFPLGSGLVEDQPLDLCMGHNQRNSDSGMYHYHFFSPCLNKEFHGVDRLDGMDVGTCVYHECETDTIKWALSGFQDGEYSGKSIIGLSKDGRPLYGPYKNDNNELWDWDKVDACNGVLDEDGSYFYVSTQWHPYISGCQGPTNLIQLGTDNDSRMPFYTNCSTNGLEEYAKDHNGVSHCKANGLSCVANQHCCSENPYCNPLETNDETIIKKECMKTEPDDIVFPTRRPDGAGCRISAECEVGSTCKNMFCRKQRG